MNFSLFSSRSTAMIGRRAIMFNTPVHFSTQIYAQVDAVEETLVALRWAHLKDTMAEVRQLLKEPKTNRALRKPSDGFEAEVNFKMAEIQNMITADAAPNRDNVQARVRALRKMVKGELYYG